MLRTAGGGAIGIPQADRPDARVVVRKAGMKRGKRETCFGRLFRLFAPLMDTERDQKMKDHLKRQLLILAGVIFFAIPVAGAAWAESLSFDEAMGKLYQGSESLKAAHMEIDQRSHEKSAALGLFLPKVEFSARYTRIDEPITIDLNDIRSVILSLHPQVPSRMVPSFDLVVQDSTFLKERVSAVWPIFTGGQIVAANRAADAFLEDARQRKRSMESILTSDLVRRYFGLQLTRRVTATRKQVLAGMDQHLYQVKKLEKAGMVARAERLHAEVARAEADREMKRAVRDEELAQTVLDSIIVAAEPVNPASPLFVARQIEPLEVFRSMAVERNPALRQIAAQKKAAHQAYRKEVGSLFPQVSLFGQRELRAQDLTVLEPEWAVGIGMSFPLFEGGARYHRIESARAVEERVSHLEAQARRDVETLTEKRYQEFMKATEQYDALLTAITAAEENLRVRTSSFDEGFATSLDVVDAQLALSRARIELLVAAYDSDVALAELLEAAGTSDRFSQYQSRVDREVLY